MTRTLASALALIAVALGTPFMVEASALVQAAKNGNEATAIALIGGGADVSERGDNSETALHWAAYNGQLDLARRLIAGGAPVNAQVRNGNTPLHHAAYAGHLEMARLLLAAGADMNAVDARGATPAGWAERNGHREVVWFLSERGARVAIGSDPEDPTQRARAKSQVGAGLSRRMGELPSLVMRVPSNLADTAPSLSLSRDMQAQPQRDAAAAPAGEAAATRQTWIQLGAFRRQSDASGHRKRLLSHHGDLLDDFRLSIVSADIEGRGRFHRLRAGPLHTAEAQRTCSALKFRGVTCLLVFIHP